MNWGGMLTDVDDAPAPKILIKSMTMVIMVIIHL